MKTDKEVAAEDYETWKFFAGMVLAGTAGYPDSVGPIARAGMAAKLADEMLFEDKRRRPV